jgi:carboxypeptidase family protein
MKARNAFVLGLVALLVVVGAAWLLRSRAPSEQADRSPKRVERSLAPLGHPVASDAPAPEPKNSTGAYPAVIGGPKDAPAEPRAAIKGRLCETHEHTPVVGVRVLLVHPTKQTTLLATTDAEGRFAVEDLDAESYSVAIDDDFWATAAATTTKASTSPSETVINCVLGGLVTGRVVDVAGRPVSGVRAAPQLVLSIDSLFDAEPGSPGIAAGTPATTDAAGRFRLRGVRPVRAVSVHASHPDYCPADSETFAVHAGEETAAGIVRLLAGGSVSGRLVDAAGAPVAAATVDVEEGSVDFSRMMQMAAEEKAGGEGRKFRATSDADGRYRVAHVPPGEKAVAVQAAGFSPARKADVIVEEGRETANVDLVLSAGAAVVGRVVDSEKSAVSGASVSIDVNPMDFLRTGKLNRRDTTTDGDGRFRLADLAPDPIDVSVTMKGLRKAQRKGLKPGAEEIEIVMTRGACIAGKVVDAATREGVPAFKLKVGRANAFAGAMSGQPAEKLEDAFTGVVDGEFEFCGLDGGSYTVEATAEGYARAKLEKVDVTEDGRAGDLVVEMKPGCTIQGAVRAKADGRAIAGARVTLGEPSPMGEFMTAVAAVSDADLPTARSSADGSFTLQGVPPGTVNLIALHRDWPMGSTPGIAATPESPTTGVEILLAAAARITGTVYGPEGRPESGAMVMLMKGFMPARQTTSNAAGHYELGGLGAGDYSLMRVAMKFKPGGNTSPGGSESVPVSVHDGDDLVVDIGKRGTDVGCRLHGRISTAGDPVRNTTLQLLRERDAGGGGFNARTASTDADGSYEILAVEPGKFVLQVIGNGIGQGAYGQSVEIAAGEREKQLDVDLPRGAIAGRVVDARTHKPIQNVFVWATLESDAQRGDEVQLMMSGRVGQGLTDADGHYEVRPIAKGTYRVRAGGFPIEIPQFASDWAGEIVDDVEVPEVGDAPLDFALERAAAIEGIVREASGPPVSGAYVSLFDDRGTNASGPLVPPTGSDGRYRITGLREGRYWLRATSSRFAPSARRSVAVRKGETTSEDVVLVDGGSLAVSVRAGGLVVDDATIDLVDESGQPVPGLTSIFQMLTDPDAAGGTTETGVRLFSHVAPGRYTIRARKDGAGSGSAAADVRDGAMTSVRVVLD